MQEIYKQRFKELFFDQIGLIRIQILCNSRIKNSYFKSFYAKDGKFLGNYNSNINFFWLSYYNIWLIFKSEFNLNNQEIRDLTIDILERKYKLRGITTKWLSSDLLTRIGKTL
jgi:hypothetical protein